MAEDLPLHQHPSVPPTSVQSKYGKAVQYEVTKWNFEMRQQVYLANNIIYRFLRIIIANIALNAYKAQETD